MEIPEGFNQKVNHGNNKVLKLKKTLYGLRYSSCAFLKYLTYKLEDCGLFQSKLHHKLYFRDKVTCIVYMDDLIFWEKYEKNIHDLVIKLHESVYDLDQ